MWETFKSTVTDRMSKFFPIRAQHAVNRKKEIFNLLLLICRD